MNLKSKIKQSIDPVLTDMIKSSTDELSRHGQIRDVFLSLLFSDNHIHTHYPGSEEDIIRVYDEIREYQNISDHKQIQQVTINEPPKEVVFHNRQAIGDILTMTSGIRDFKTAFPETRVGVVTTARHIWDNNPHIDHNFVDNDKILKIGPGFLTNKSNLWNLHMCNAFRMDIESKLNLSIPQGPIRPDVWFSEEEYNRSPLIEGPYWIIIVGGEPGWTAKMYPMDRWQKVVDMLPEIQFVQLGVSTHPYPHLNNVIDFVGKTEDRETGIRDLFNIFLHAQGSVGLVSMHMHLSTAFNNPCVVIAGAREPAGFTQYFGHQYLQTNGTLPCALTSACWKCDVKGCKNQKDDMPKCVDTIEPEEVVGGVRKYYKGGRLEYGKKVPNTFFKNIVKEKKIFVAPKVEQIDNQHLEQYGFKWGGGSITDRDWIFIKETIEKYNINTVLEFGAGLSTLLFANTVSSVETYETNDKWINDVSAKLSSKGKIIKWDGKNFQSETKKYDLAFVDGPAGGGTREFSTKAASELADLVIVHDAGREWEKKWQEMYLKPSFILKSKGGHRCHFWVRKSSIEIDTSKPLARMITTCRGYGGSERSTIEIMKMFLEKGYTTQLVPTGNISGEYGRNIPEGVVVGSWEDIKNPSDITILYCSDTIWNYKSPQYDIMNQLNAKRKVMVINYKAGSIGQTPWTKDWDKYLFLNSEHEAEILERMPNVKTKVLPPPTNLTLFFLNEPNYSLPLKLIRHNSQGDSKYPDYTNELLAEILELDPSIEFHCMPAKSDCIKHERIIKYPKNTPPVWEFLKNGNCFFYFLPLNYTEGGPKVIMEAQASGLPVICDNHSGPKDRVTEETGWLCNSRKDYIEVIKEILANPEILRIKGKKAREWAKKEYNPNRWVEEILC